MPGGGTPRGDHDPLDFAEACALNVLFEMDRDSEFVPIDCAKKRCKFSDHNCQACHSVCFDVKFLGSVFAHRDEDGYPADINSVI